MTQLDEPNLRFDLIEGGTVLRLLLARPKANVLSRAMMGELEEALRAHRKLPSLRLVVLAAEGPHFSFGASIPEHRPELAPAMLADFHRLVLALYRYPVPVAAAVRGQCLGGGFELVLACHLVFAATDARFGCPEIKLGVFPPLLAVLGPERLGAPLTERLVVTGESIDAATAERCGFASLLEGPSVPHEAVLDWYRETLRPLSAFSLRQACRAMRHSSGRGDRLARALAAAERQYVEELLPSHDGNEGIEAFLSKRPPAWTDR